MVTGIKTIQFVTQIRGLSVTPEGRQRREREMLQEMSHTFNEAQAQLPWLIQLHDGLYGIFLESHKDLHPGEGGEPLGALLRGSQWQCQPPPGFCGSS